MLQWMGGSRQKVTTSRKSTHKRKRQYFEQRKRQQQQTAGLESYADGRYPCTEHYEDNRSLDILSLANVSTLAQDLKTSRLKSSDKPEDDDYTLNHQYTNVHPADKNEGIFVDQCLLHEENCSNHTGFTSGISSSHQTEAEDSVKLSVHSHDNHEGSVGNSKNLDHIMLSPAQQISVIDLVCDGVTNSNAEENTVHTEEAHLAFSIEGLGKLNTQTPVQSPEMHGRAFPNIFSSPKEARQPTVAKHFDYGFSDLQFRVDIDFSPDHSSIEQPFHSRNTLDALWDSNQKFLNFVEPSSSNWNYNTLQDFLDDDELFCNVGECGKNIWNECPSVLDYSTCKLGCESFRKNWVEQRNLDCDDDSFHIQDLGKQDFNFKSWNLQKNSSST